MNKFILLLLLLIASPLSAGKDPELKKRGTVTVYYKNSKQIWYTGTNNNRLKEGTWSYYAPDGQLTHTDTYKAGVLDGERRVFMAGTVTAIENYSNGKPNGIQRYYSPTGAMNSRLFFSDGNPDSAQFWEPGEAMYYKAERYANKKVIARRWYERNGTLNATEYYENEQKTGVWKTYTGYTNDTVPLTIITYKNNTKNGFCRERRGRYDLFESYYRNDTLQGTFKHLNKGELQVEALYKNGKLHGVYKSYRNGKLIEEATYEKGIQIGITHIYDASTGRVASYVYWSGKADLHGNAMADSVIEMNALGLRIREEIYVRQNNPAYPNTVTRKIRVWHANGKLKLTGQFVNETQQGKWTEYYPSGKPKAVLNFSANQLNGKAEFWHENGQKALEFIALNNEVEQLPKVWKTDGRQLAKDQQQYIEIIEQFKPDDVVFLALMNQERDQEVIKEGDRSGDAYVGTQEAVMEAPRFPANEINPYLEAGDCFPGGDSAMHAFIKQQLIYPVVDAVFLNQGVVAVSVVLDTQGKVVRSRISHDLTNSSIALRTEALRLVSILPLQAPLKNGKPMSVDITIRIKFSLPN